MSWVQAAELWRLELRIDSVIAHGNSNARVRHYESVSAKRCAGLIGSIHVFESGTRRMTPPRCTCARCDLCEVFWIGFLIFPSEALQRQMPRKRRQWFPGGSHSRTGSAALEDAGSAHRRGDRTRPPKMDRGADIRSARRL